MQAKKKNIFSRRPNKGRTFWRGLFFGSLAAILGVFLGTGFMFLAEIPAGIPEKFSQETQNKTSTNRGVAVFTGGQGRVKAGFDVLETFDTINYLLISGVHPQTTQQEILRQSGLEGVDKNFAGKLELDYQSHSTFDNIAQTKAWVKKYNLTEVVLVTSSYHIPRAKMLLKNQLPDVKIILHPVLATDVGWRIYALEYLKYTAVYVNRLTGGLLFDRHNSPHV